MKKFNRIIYFSIGIFILLSILQFQVIGKYINKTGSLYKVEINQLNQKLIEDFNSNINLDGYTEIISLEVLDHKEALEEEKINNFFKYDNEYETFINPIYKAGIFEGYVKYFYVNKYININKISIYIEVFLIIMEVFLISVLIYIKYNLINPFYKFSRIPLELSKGKFIEDIKEEKSRYFGKFIWGISQLKESLEVTRKRELNLHREKKMMLLSLSHDIKTPLNTIKLYSKALVDGIYEEEDSKIYVSEQIGKKADEIGDYIEEIIKTSREDIVEIQINMDEFYLKELMDKVKDAYFEKCRLQMLEFTIEDYENKIINGDYNRILEIFDNLIDNAIKYGDGKEIRITLYEEEYCQLIKVYNSGELVSDNDYNHIFESFYRGTNSEGKQGNGLGLYICREIMRKMGGDIFAQREENGMAFVLVIV